jgi:hypothetical protein
MPLSGDGAEVDMLFGIVDYAVDGRARRKPGTRAG